MKILVFADIHGNLPALEKLLKEEKADLYISLGDVVNYGPWQNECVELLETLDYKILLMGNHEEYYLRGEYVNTGLAGRFFEFCYPQFRKFNLINNYIDSVRMNSFNFRHSYSDRIIYPDTHIAFDDNYIIGHSHHQSLQECGKFKMYVIGSVGQNRQYINQIDYLLIDKIFELRHLRYDESQVIRKMKSKHYPQEFIDYYSKKQKA